MEQYFDPFVSDYREQMDSLVSPFGSKHSILVAKKIDICAQLGNSFDLDIQRVLDFGSGIGLSLPYLIKTFPQAEIKAVDVSNEALEVSRRSIGDKVDHGLISDREIPLDSESVDLVFCSGVFHHISKNERLHWLKEINRVLRKGGLAVIFEHNPFHPITRWLVSRCPWDKGVELLDMKESMDLFRRNDFYSISFSYHLIFPPGISKLQNFERKLGKLPIGAQYFIYGFKKLRY